MSLLSQYSLNELIQKMRDLHILCIGDVMLDRFISGEVKRISPEAPIPVLRVRDEQDYFGGAGNVARNIKALEGNVTLLGVVGQDTTSDELRNLSVIEGINAELISDPTRRTAIKQRYVSEGQQMLRCDYEDNIAINNDIKHELKQKIDAYLPKCHAVILSDYNKGVLNEDICQYAIQQAKKHHKLVIIDPKGDDFSKYKGASIITPNMQEFRHMAHLPNQDEATITEYAQKTIRDYDVQYLLVTRSEKGMSLYQEKSQDHFATIAQDVYDVVGAGDTVVATLALLMAINDDMRDNIMIANIAAGFAVSKSGTATTNWNEIERSYHHKTGVGRQHIIHDWHQAKQIIATQKQLGQKIGFTNGCFDLLHEGHIYLLEQARQLCDFLVVGVNSNLSIQRLKGKQRPIQDLNSRMKILSALEIVDMVVSFDDDTPYDLILNIEPDMLAKGADYELQDIVGAQEVIDRGGSVHRLKLYEHQSTTSIINKIIESA